MRKLLRWLLLAGAVMTLLCVSALAAEPTEAGMYNITGSGATLTPQTADKSTITADSTNDDYKGYYANAARFDVTANGLTEDSQYLLLVVRGSTTPTAENIVYVDQAAADSSGAVTFNAYPSTLAQDHYCVYVVGKDKPVTTKAAEFDTYQPYTLGDCDGVEGIDVRDVAAVLNHIVGNHLLEGDRYMAADVTKDTKVDINDAAMLLNYIVNNIESLD